jgi:hypothetical protein
MTARTRQTITIVISTVLARLGFHLYTGYTADDAFITFRYAENLAAGLGFVYNEGEQVLGTSTPLYTLLLAVLRIPRFPLPEAALVLSLAASAGTALILYRFASLARLRHLAFLPVLCYILWPRSLPAETAGLETAVFTLLVTASFYYLHRRLDIYAVGAATLATLTRPEGFWALTIVLAVCCYRHRYHRLAFSGLSLFLLVPWLGFAGVYFGSPLPHSITAKLALYSRFGTSEFWPSLKYLLALHTPFGWLTVAAAVAGAIWLWRTQRFGRAEILWLAGMFAFFALANTRLFFWYIVPIYPIFLLFVSAAAMHVWDRLSTAAQQNSWGHRLIALTASILLIFGAMGPLAFYRQAQDDLDRAHRRVGWYLYAEAKPDAVVAAEDIGYLGYYSLRRILDRDGLVSPEAVPYNRSGSYLQLILDYSPDWVVARWGSPISPFLDTPAFDTLYNLQADFEHPDGTYQIYCRR